jgi:hypothetical protein
MKLFSNKSDRNAGQYRKEGGGASVVLRSVHCVTYVWYLTQL